MEIPIHHTLSYLKKGILISTVAILLLLSTHAAIAIEPDKTSENVQKKAIIVKHNAKLFKKFFGDEGDHELCNPIWCRIA